MELLPGNFDIRMDSHAQKYQRPRTRKAFLLTSNVWSFLVSNTRISAAFRITISKRNRLNIWSFVFVVEYKSFWRHRLERPSPWIWTQEPESRTWRQTFGTRRAFLLTSNKQQTTPALYWKAPRGWTHPFELEYPKGIIRLYNCSSQVSVRLNATSRNYD